MQRWRSSQEQDRRERSSSFTPPGDETHSRRYLNDGEAGSSSPALSADPRQMTRALKDRARNRVAWRRQTDIRRSACLSGKTIAPRRVESLSERSRARRG